MIKNQGHTIKPQLDPEIHLTAWDYMNAPIQELRVHPDFNIDRWSRLCNALGEAIQLIEQAMENEQ